MKKIEQMQRSSFWKGILGKWRLARNSSDLSPAEHIGVIIKDQGDALTLQESGPLVILLKLRVKNLEIELERL